MTTTPPAAICNFRAVHVMLALDISGPDPAQVIAAGAEFVEATTASGDTVQISAATFHRNGRIEIDADQTKFEIQQQIYSAGALPTGGSDTSAVVDALQWAGSPTFLAPTREKIIVVITDGLRGESNATVQSNIATLGSRSDTTAVLIIPQSSVGASRVYGAPVAPQYRNGNTAELAGELLCVPFEVYDPLDPSYWEADFPCCVQPIANDGGFSYCFDGEARITSVSPALLSPSLQHGSFAIAMSVQFHRYATGTILAKVGGGQLLYSLFIPAESQRLHFSYLSAESPRLLREVSWSIGDLFDDLPHQVLIRLGTASAVLTVDNARRAPVGLAGNLLDDADCQDVGADCAFYLGGLPDDLATPSSSGFDGCLTAMRLIFGGSAVSGHPEDPASPIVNPFATGFSTTATTTATTTNSGYCRLECGFVTTTTSTTSTSTTETSTTGTSITGTSTTTTLPPTRMPTPSPTLIPTPNPTASPTPAPTLSPTVDPTQAPTMPPSISPTPTPTASPTLTPQCANNADCTYFDPTNCGYPNDNCDTGDDGYSSWYCDSEHQCYDSDNCRLTNDAIDGICPPPDAVQVGWDNHFAAFATLDLDRILLDYTETSVVNIYDFGSGVARSFTGLDEISRAFDALFFRLADNTVNGLSAPVVTVDEERGAAFTVWQAPGVGIDHVTDTFDFVRGSKIAVQNMVVFPVDANSSPLLPVGSTLGSATPHDATTGPASDRFAHHFGAFAAANLVENELDYAENCVVRVHDVTTGITAEYTGYEGLGNIFTQFYSLDYTGLSNPLTRVVDPGARNDAAVLLILSIPDLAGQWTDTFLAGPDGRSPHPEHCVPIYARWSALNDDNM